jgi:two-component system LytT family sensor kinase
MEQSISLNSANSGTMLIKNFIYSDNFVVRLFRHLTFWAVDVINYLLVVSIHTPITSAEVLEILLRIPLLAAATYFIIYYMIPLFRRRESIPELLVCSILVILFLGFGLRYYRYYLIEPLIYPLQEISYNIWDPRRVLSELIQASMVIGLATTIKLLKSRTMLEVHNEKLEHEKKRTELSFLKAQMQPHFLFNTLNTLYSETIQDSGKAQEVVLHLSDLLRFVLEECSKPLIPLKNEIKMIQDFVALEKLRHGARLYVNLEIGKVSGSAMISPLILMPFVENSFKHSLRSKRGRIEIDITINMKDSVLHLEIINPVGTEINVKVNGTGQGLLNTRHQLDLLYQNNYTLTITPTENAYFTKLTLPLKLTNSYAENNLHYN